MSGEHGREQDYQIKKEALGTSWKRAILDPLARPEGFEPRTPNPQIRSACEGSFTEIRMKKKAGFSSF